MNFRWSDTEAFYVNLADRPDRRERMEIELSRVGIRAGRYEAARPEDVPMLSKFATMRQRTPGAIGCHVSQCALIARAVACDRDVLVLEDDVVFCDDLHERMAHAERFLAGREWDVLSLAGTVHVRPARWHVAGHSAGFSWCDCGPLNRDCETTEDPRFLRMYGSWFTYAYIVNHRSSAKILGMLDADVHRSIGIDFLFMSLSPRLKVYAYTPGSAFQIDNESDIGNRRPDGSRSVTEFSHFLKMGPYVFQRRREDFDPVAFDWGEARVART